MASLNRYPKENHRPFREEIKNQALQASSLIEASQLCAELFCKEFRESIILARVYVTLSYQQLGEREARFAHKIAKDNNLVNDLHNDTVVLTLFGTAGVQPQWNDRSSSQGHLAIPLVSPDFVKNLPMLLHLMHEMGLGLSWLVDPTSDIVMRTLGSLSAVLHVRDATVASDSEGRLIIPAQDFVTAHGVKTVFGIGAGYVKRSFVSILIFSKEEIARQKVEAFMPLVTLFRAATMKFVSQGKLFAI